MNTNDIIKSLNMMSLMSPAQMPPRLINEIHAALVERDELLESVGYADHDELAQSIVMLRQLLQDTNDGAIDQHMSVPIQMGIDALVVIEKIRANEHIDKTNDTAP